MQSITSTAGLKNAIQLLEAEQVTRGQQLKEQFYVTYESYKPVNLLRSTLHDIYTSPNLIENILGTVIGLATGYFSSYIFAGASGLRFKKLIGPALQIGVTKFIGQNFNTIRSFGEVMLLKIFRKKKLNATSRD